MEDDLKILKVEFLSNCLLDQNQILNLSFYDQTIFNKYLKWRRHFLEGNLKILKVEDLNHPLLDHLQILNLRLDDHMTMTIFYKSLEWRWSPGGVLLLRWKLEECGYAQPSLFIISFHKVHAQYSTTPGGNPFGRKVREVEERKRRNDNCIFLVGYL